MGKSHENRHWKEKEGNGMGMIARECEGMRMLNIPGLRHVYCQYEFLGIQEYTLYSYTV